MDVKQEVKHTNKAICKTVTFKLTVTFSYISCRCLGASTHLKNKYGSGYLLEVKLTTKDSQSTSLDDRLAGIHQYIVERFPGATVMEQFSERVQYKVPRSSVTSLSRAFTVLEEGNVIIPPAKYVCGRVYCFHVVCPNKRTKESVSVTFCFLNILKSH